MVYDGGASAGAGNARTGAGYESPPTNGDPSRRTDADGSAHEWADPSRYASEGNERPGADGWDGRFPEPTGGEYEYYPHNGEVSHYVVDADGDGRPEAVWGDPNADGHFRTVRYDTDGDGELDTTVSDLDGDGRVDSIIVDRDEDGIPEYGIADLDNNGYFDHEYFSNDGDGPVEIIKVDTDGDGHFDTTYYDQDGDGQADAPPFP
jgi:hypothetical protein